MNEELHVNAHASEAELKARVLNFMVQNLDKLHGRIVLYHDSDPVLYDEDGNWTFDVQTTTQMQSGNMKTQTTLDRPLGATPLLASHILLPEGLCKEAFLDSKGNCVAVQLSALLKKPISRIENEIDRFFHALEDKSQYEVDGHVYSWREMGVTTKIIAQIGESNNMNTYILSGGRKIAQFKHNRTNNRACLCFTIESDHAWFYDNNQARLSISHLDVHTPRPSTSQSVAHEFQSTREEYRTWKEWYPGMTEAGHYDTEDIAEARLYYLSQNISPRVSYKSGTITALHVPLYKQHIYRKPQYANSLLRWSDELKHAGYDAPYKGEGLASFTHNVVLALVKNKRRKVTRVERFKILEHYEHRCSICGDKGDSFSNQLELDHPVPLRDCGDNEQSLVPLCRNCHNHKSYLECLTPFQENPLASVFEKSVYEAFHESPKPRQAVQQLHQPTQNALQIDAVKCRRNALQQNLEPLPIFSPLDQIRAMDSCVLGDYNYIDKRGGDPRCFNICSHVAL